MAGEMSTDKSAAKKVNINLNFPQVRVNVVAAVLFLVPAVAGALWTWHAQRPGRSSRVSCWAGWRVFRRRSLPNGSAVVLRLGRYVGYRGPGLFWIVPLVDVVAVWIDQRTITTNFAAEQTLTSDAVPVNVDAVLFWMVYDPEKAALEVQDYQQAVSWAAHNGAVGHHRPHVADQSTPWPRADRVGVAEVDRRSDQSLGRDGAIRRDAGRRYPRLAAGRHVARGPGSPRKAGSHHPRRSGSGNRPSLRNGRQVLHRQSDGPPPAGDEHALSSRSFGVMIW